MSLRKCITINYANEDINSLATVPDFPDLSLNGDMPHLKHITKQTQRRYVTGDTELRQSLKAFRVEGNNQKYLSKRA